MGELSFDGVCACERSGKWKAPLEGPLESTLYTQRPMEYWGSRPMDAFIFLNSIRRSLVGETLLGLLSLIEGSPLVIRGTLGKENVD